MARNWLDQFVKDGTVSPDQLVEAEEMAGNLGITPEEALMKSGNPARLKEMIAKSSDGRPSGF